MNGPADIVVFEDEAVLHALREVFVVFAEAVECRYFIAKDAAEMQDHDSVSVLLWRQLEQAKHFRMVVKITKRVVNDLFPWRTKLCKLARMGGQTMTEFSSNLTSLSQFFRDEWCKLVSIFFMTGEREHFTAESQEFDTIFVIPSQHLHDILRICFA